MVLIPTPFFFVFQPRDQRCELAARLPMPHVVLALSEATATLNVIWYAQDVRHWTHDIGCPTTHAISLAR